MTSQGRRWDGRTWLARTALAALPVVIHGAARHPSLDVVIAVVCGWIPLISITASWLQRARGDVQRLAAVAVDLGALTALGLLVPPLGPAVLVLLVPAGVLHAAAGSAVVRVIAMAAVAAAQLVVLGASDVSDDAVRLVVVLDVATAILSAVLLAEQDRHRRRSRAALRRADELTDAVLTGIGEAVVVTDAAGRVTSTNDAAALTFGAQPAGSCTASLALHRGAGGLDCSQGCPLLDDAEDLRAQAEVQRDHPSGARQDLLVNVRGVRGPSGRVREVVHSFRDITRLKQAEHAKTLFLATASHELKTPLAIISGYTSLLENADLPAEQRNQAVTTIHSRIEHLSQIIERLLLSSRIEGGNVELTTEPLDVRPIVVERVTALQEALARTIRLHAPDDVPLVAGDATAIGTVIDHLVENAVKYSPDGGGVAVRIAVTARSVEIDVADLGVGMSPGDAEHCFDAFWQAESADTRRFGGSGVGLYIVRSMSRAMGGDTRVVRAVPGEGTTFRVTLLRADAEPTRTDEDTERRPTMMDEFVQQVR